MQYKRQEIQECFEERLHELMVHQGGDWILENLDDLHNEIFNNDYYIIGRHQATEWLGEHVFEIIDFIREYEQDNFGEMLTDISEPEHVVNMYVYIIGEEIVSEYRQEKEAA